MNGIKTLIRKLLPPNTSQRISTIWRVGRLTANATKNQEIDSVIQMISLPDSYLVATGYMQSKISGIPQDQQQNALPWMNYAIIDFLKERLDGTQSVFEYGSGYSTLFFSGRVKEVVSVEYNQEWLKKVTELVNGMTNVNIIYKTLEDNYVTCINEQKKRFDIIIIDGRKRGECARNTLNCLSERGVIVLDDSERERYAAIFPFYDLSGFKHLTFTGLKATGFRISSTTIFYKSDNCLGI
ncbi:MAG: class I SAM-dependent methyltransferase [Chitinophagaceae bacterium]|nr:class I SAM-dependent methyltransferase [Chitinophagaceae bacterium]